jgi:hypothetical protein
MKMKTLNNLHDRCSEKQKTQFAEGPDDGQKKKQCCVMKDATPGGKSEKVVRKKQEKTTSERGNFPGVRSCQNKQS